MMPQESAEKALTDNLETANEIVRLEVVNSLAKVGATKALDGSLCDHDESVGQRLGGNRCANKW